MKLLKLPLCIRFMTSFEGRDRGCVSKLRIGTCVCKVGAANGARQLGNISPLHHLFVLEVDSSISLTRPSLQPQPAQALLAVCAELKPLLVLVSFAHLDEPSSMQAVLAPVKPH